MNAMTTKARRPIHRDFYHSTNWEYLRQIDSVLYGGERRNSCSLGVRDVPRKHALVVATSLAASAQAAKVVAKAAAQVMRLSGRGFPSHFDYYYLEEEEEEEEYDWAATKIQATFRGHLARKAYKALKGVVRFQALVRGHLVRMQARLALRCMQALVRFQARARTRQLRNIQKSLPSTIRWDCMATTDKGLLAYEQRCANEFTKSPRNNNYYIPYTKCEGDVKLEPNWSWPKCRMPPQPWEKSDFKKDYAKGASTSTSRRQVRKYAYSKPNIILH